MLSCLVLAAPLPRGALTEPGLCAGHGVLAGTRNGTTTCVCDPGWRGIECSESTCDPECSHGRCVDGYCQCHPGWTGTSCQVPALPCFHDCSGRGSCVAGVCHCAVGWTGNDCSRSLCPAGCRGRCVGDGVCACDAGHIGADCSVSLCADDCAGHGSCVAPGRCVCAEGWHGERCATSSCPGLVYTEGRWTPCSARGDCVRGTCVCEGDARGPACSFDAEVERRAEESRTAFAVPPRRPMPRS